jgi:HK97 gp10 family phage protein
VAKGDAYLTLNLKTPQARAKAQAAVLRATVEWLEEDVIPTAKRNSPVLTGHNASTIDGKVEETPQGPMAVVYTQSGYGGYLEVGTSRMRARPYIWPALQENVDKIRKRIKRLIRNG